MPERHLTAEEKLAAEYTVTAADDTLELGPFEDGFSSRTVLGALFVALVMMPGSIYLGLVAGQSLGPAAEWVTIILFAEIARRSFAQLKRQEVFVLFYVASAIAAVTMVQLALSGGPFAMAIWRQFLIQSPQTSTLAKDIPDWVVPPVTSAAIQNRNLAHLDWWWSPSKGLLSPLLLIVIGYVLSRMAWFGLGYILFRIVSDTERLPFPMAPIAAQGATALAESTDRKESGEGEYRRGRSWRWRVFSVGASLGAAFGLLYVLLPVVTGLFMAKPIMLFPIPFVDFTRNVESFLPASLISLSFDMSLLLAGMILPFRLILGTFIAVMATSVFGNPILLKLGAFPHWTPGNGLLVNQMILSFDFWMSVSIGLAAAVALVGIWNMVRTFVGRTRRKDSTQNTEAEKDTTVGISRRPSKERGDFPLWIAGALFISATVGFIWITHILVPGFPVWIIVLFGFIWTPLQSYISARLVGLTGRGIGVPFLKETVFITSGYKKVDIWFAPIPLWDFGGAAQRFRELELTRTRFTSIIKAEFLMAPIIFVCSFLFWWFFWHLNQIPSVSFPYAARIWPVAARQAYLIFTANSTDQPLLLQALNPKTIIGAFGVGLALYVGLSTLGMPVIFFYGLIGGIGAPLHAGLPLLVGALAGRYYFQRRFGRKQWSRYVPVVAAGFSCGMGLAGMTAVALSLIAQCTRDLPF
ncbi:MAG: peptide transporter [Kiritimatiellaeota bacterium]|nr:peptide transporter [Kiritimatiellota bacterium]